MKEKVKEVLITEANIKEKVRELGEQISNDYAGKEILVIGILKGAIIFLADLIRELKIPVYIDFIAVSSYGAATKSSGIVRILKDLDEDIRNKHVLLIEDIIDTGLTLNYLLKNLKSRGPASLEVCTLLQKKEKQRVPLDIKYVGFAIPDVFVVGYGLDYAQQHRCIPRICSIEFED
ncbi:MAG: hypoxanthine phosphoribosyltransferase [Actinomycetia bacterium]|nr:hypoxanthine phosphoribosyltransferase [Actinomycetes bacterium]